MVELDLDVDLLVASSNMRATLPQVVFAEQFVNAATVLTSVTMLSVTTDYTQPNHPISALVSSPTQQYTLNQTDWMVTGPNVEGVYPDAIFRATFGTPVANSFCVYAPPVAGDGMTAAAVVSTDNAAPPSVTINWGDGTATSVVAPVSGTPAKVNHTYAAAGSYLVAATAPSAPSVSLTFVASTQTADVGVSPMTGADLAALDIMGGGPVLMAAPYPEDSGATVNERITDVPRPETFAEISTAEATGEYTPDQMTRVEAGLSPYEPDTSTTGGVP